MQLYLIHWPVAFKTGDELFPKTNNDTEVDISSDVSISQTWKGRQRLAPRDGSVLVS